MSDAFSARLSKAKKKWSEFDKKCEDIALKIWEVKFDYIGYGVCSYVIYFFLFQSDQDKMVINILALLSLIVAFHLYKAKGYVFKKKSWLSKLRDAFIDFAINKWVVNPEYREKIITNKNKISTALRYVAGFSLTVSMLSLLFSILLPLNFNDVLRDWFALPWYYTVLLFIYLLFWDDLEINIQIGDVDASMSVEKDNGSSIGIEHKTEGSAEIKSNQDVTTIVVEQNDSSAKVSIGHELKIEKGTK